MLSMHIVLQGDGAFADLQREHGDPIHLTNEITVAGLEAGMAGGKPSVGFGFVLPNGRWVLAETSLALFLTAADALRARLGDPRQ